MTSLYVVNTRVMIYFLKISLIICIHFMIVSCCDSFREESYMQMAPGEVIKYNRMNTKFINNNDDDRHYKEAIDESELRKRTMRKNGKESRLWPRINNQIVVPFSIDSGSNFTSFHLMIIQDAMIHIMGNSCIKFVKRTSETSYVHIKHGSGCRSKIGMIGGRQLLHLNKKGKCSKSIGSVTHELLHVLGFFHMHNHPDRDNHIKINFHNIKPGLERYFEKFDKFESDYDIFSIMHYSPFAGSKFEKSSDYQYATIVAKDKKLNKYLGQRNRMTPSDISRIKRLYKCDCIDSGEENC